jgi:DNA-binding Lrp family transcriptional regulator
MLSTDNARLIDAMQIAPRASWAALGEILGISAATAARRWQRLVDEGIAWVTAGPGVAVSNAQCLAHAEVICQPDTRFAVASELARHPPAITVEITTGNADLLVTVGALDLQTMSHYLLDHLANVPGVLRTRARIVTRLYSEGSSWRLHVLPDEQVDALRRLNTEAAADLAPAEATAPGDVGEMSESTKAMLTHLLFDGRASYAELAERGGISPATARRRLNELVRSKVILLRTDVSAIDAGWPVETYMWADTPVDTLVDSARQLSGMPQTRLTATVAASESLTYCSWLQTTEEIHHLELAIAAQLPRLRVVDRFVVLRAVKRNGRLLDSSGRAAGVVPFTVWDDALCPSSPGAGLGEADPLGGDALEATR